MSFDFASARTTDDTRTLEVRHPATGKLLAKIDLLSINAERPTEVRRKQERKRYKNMRSLKLDPVELENDALDILAACTTNWTGEDGPILWNGQPLEYNTSNARFLYENVKWLRDEVDRFVNDVTVFLEPLPTPSGSSSDSSSV